MNATKLIVPYERVLIGFGDNYGITCNTSSAKCLEEKSRPLPQPLSQIDVRLYSQSKLNVYNCSKNIITNA